MAHMTPFHARKCLLGVTKFKFNILTNFFHKNMKNYNGAWGKLDNGLNRYNSGYV